MTPEGVNAVHRREARQVEDFVRHHQGAVRGFLVVLGCSLDRVDDLVQDVFLSFLTARFEDRGERSTRAFLRRIARNLFLKATERERRVLELSDVHEAEDLWAEFEGDDDGASYLEALRKCLTSVRGRAAEVLRMRYEESTPVGKVAERLELTESGVKSILVRTKARLRDCIERRIER